METKTTIYKLSSIMVNSFSQSKEIENISNQDNPSIVFSLTLKANVRSHNLIADAVIVYLNGSEKELAKLSYSFVTNIEDLESHINEKDSTIYLPDTLIRTIIFDTFATGRAMISERLAGTALKDDYLPLGGAEDIWNKFKANPKINIIKDA